MKFSASTTKKPRVLVLDCGGITNPDCEAGNSEVAAAMGVEPDKARAGHKAAWVLARSDPSFCGYWSRLFEVAGVPEPERTPMQEAACEAALAPALRRCYADSLRIAQKLKDEHGFTIGIISNHLVAPNLFEYCAEGAGLHALVSHPSLLVVSQAVGLGKPDPAIYQLFFERLRALDPGVTPAELLFVDDKEKNVEAAMSLGWRGLVFNAGTASKGDFEQACAALGLLPLKGETG